MLHTTCQPHFPFLRPQAHRTRTYCSFSVPSTPNAFFSFSSRLRGTPPSSSWEPSVPCICAHCTVPVSLTVCSRVVWVPLIGSLFREIEGIAVGWASNLVVVSPPPYEACCAFDGVVTLACTSLYGWEIVVAFEVDCNFSNQRLEAASNRHECPPSSHQRLRLGPKHQDHAPCTACRPHGISD